MENNVPKLSSNFRIYGAFILGLLTAVAVTSCVEIYLPLAGMVDLAEERTRLERELEQAVSQVVRLEALLASGFADKAPETVVAKEREKLEDYKMTVEKIKAQLG